ncbi:MAG TPA: hypothetical protein VLA24_04425 [Pseudomonadales bacterium]|nr:hypothetical protein [Pseudomonadales bacterium]
MYKIVSPRVGTPGDTYTPVEGVNVEALLAGGFIVKSKPKTTKSDNIPENKE